MTGILFVCWGNICRSPMAEFILKDMVTRKGLAGRFHIESAATSTEEIGNPVYPPAAAELARHGIGCSGHRARQVTLADYEKFDYIIGMENIHIQIMKNRIFAPLGGDPKGKLHLCMDYASHPGQEIEDPWYTGRFEKVCARISDCCAGLLDELMRDKRER